VTEPSEFGFPNGSGGGPSDAELARSETPQAGRFRRAVSSS
jgi:hypothetical protein